MKDGSSRARWRSSLQIVTQFSSVRGHELCSNAVRVPISRENCLHCSIWHINDCSNVRNGSPTILMHKPPNCFHIFRCWARGRSPWLSSFSCDVLPLSKRACHSKHLARLMALFPYARRVISKVSAPDLPSFTQNLVFAVCSSFTSMLKSQMWRHACWQTLVLCNSQRSQRRHSAYLVAKFSAPKHSARIHVLPWVGGLWNWSRNFLIHLRNTYAC
jgi:hypothetical protein